MTVSKERKAELTAQFGNTPVDTGNPKVQVAILSERIKELTEHMKSHQKDFHTRRGLLMLVVVVFSPTSRRTTSSSTVSSSRLWASATTSSKDLYMLRASCAAGRSFCVRA